MEREKMGDKGRVLIILFRGAKLWLRGVVLNASSLGYNIVYGLQRERPPGQLRDGYYLRQLRRQA